MQTKPFQHRIEISAPDEAASAELREYAADLVKDIKALEAAMGKLDSSAAEACEKLETQRYEYYAKSVSDPGNAGKYKHAVSSVSGRIAELELGLDEARNEIESARRALLERFNAGRQIIAPHTLCPARDELRRRMFAAVAPFESCPGRTKDFFVESSANRALTAALPYYPFLASTAPETLLAVARQQVASIEALLAGAFAFEFQVNPLETPQPPAA